MDEITIGTETYISSKRAAKITGYAKDYIGQLCREGRVAAKLVGRNWYVLESALREHRFGPEEAQKVEEPTPVPSSTASWDAPRYQAESPTLVPPLTIAEDNQPQKPTEEARIGLEETDKVITDMQSAWQEWFSSKQNALPDGQKDFTEENLPMITPEEPIEALPEVARAEPVAPIEEETKEDVSETVHISRITEPEEPQSAVAAPEEESVDEPVILHRTNTDREEGEVVPMNHPLIDLSAPQEAPRRSKKRSGPTKGSRGSNVILKAALVSVAGLAVAATFIGTGAADRLLEKANLGSGPQSRLIQYLGGSSSVVKEQSK